MIIYRGGRRQRGYGIGGIFKSLFRKAMPLLAEGGKIITKNALDLGQKVITDISRGQDIGKSFEKHGVNAAINAAGDVVSAGGKAVAGNKSKKRKRNVPTSRPAKRLKGRVFADIYDKDGD